MKHRAATLTTLITGALMLVLSVLPHHHHGKIIHFGVVERCETCRDCETNDPLDPLKTAEHKHSHSEDPDCDLRHLFVISAREEYLSLGYITHTGQDRSTIDPVMLTLFFETYVPFTPATDSGKSLKFFPIAEPLCSVIAGRIFALRAPPCFIA